MPGARSSMVSGVTTLALPSSTTCAPAGADVSANRPVVLGRGSTGGRWPTSRDAATTESRALTAAFAVAAPFRQYAFAVAPTVRTSAAAATLAIHRLEGRRTDRTNAMALAAADGRPRTRVTGSGRAAPAAQSSSSALVSR